MEPQKEKEKKETQLEQRLVEEYGTREEEEIAPRDALYHTIRVPFGSVGQPTHHRISAMPESTHQEDRRRAMEVVKGREDTAHKTSRRKIAMANGDSAAKKA